MEMETIRIYAKNINQVLGLCSGFSDLEAELSVSSQSLAIKYWAKECARIEERIKKLVDGDVLEVLDKHAKAYILVPNKKCDNIDNDELYEDLDKFLEGEFSDLEGFYKELTKCVFALEKKHRIDFGPNEYIFMMRHFNELKFKQKPAN